MAPSGGAAPPPRHSAVYVGIRWLGLDRETAMLIGAGGSICGAAAVVATQPVGGGQAHKVSVTVATVVVFGTLGMFVYPLAYPHLHLSETGFGLYAESTIQEVAQVVVAARAVGEQPAATAVVARMLRVMMLAPFLLLLTRYVSPNAQTRRVHVPWFAILFVAVSGVNSLQLRPPTESRGCGDRAQITLRQQTPQEGDSRKVQQNRQRPTAANYFLALWTS